MSIPKHAHGTQNLGRQTSSTNLIVGAAMELFDRIIDSRMTVRRITIVASHVVSERNISSASPPEQLDLFTDYEAVDRQREAEEKELERERRQQQALLTIRRRFGKNAILKGLNYQEGATTKDRNQQIGGHKA